MVSPSLKFDNIYFILVRPQLAENIGMATRAMLNFSFKNLILVNPRAGSFPSDKAIDASVGAGQEIFPQTQIFDTLDEALQDFHLIVATSVRRREMAIPWSNLEHCAQKISAEATVNQKIAVIFGAERSGLDNDEIARAHIIVEIPTNPDFSSLNLAQAVSICGYEISKNLGLAYEHHNPIGEPAKFDEVDYLIKRINHEIGEKGFFKSHKMRPTIERNIRNFLQRGRATSQEIQTLQGVITALLRK